MRALYRTAVLDDFPDTVTVGLGDKPAMRFRKATWSVNGEKRGLRYGTNPSQAAALYIPEEHAAILESLRWVKWGKGGPSVTNIQDGIRGMQIVGHFPPDSISAAAVMKHLNPCGVAIWHIPKTDIYSQANLYTSAREADPRAAFGSVVALNYPVTGLVAARILESFVEVVYSPAYSHQALAMLEEKKDLRLAEVPDMHEYVQTIPNITMMGGALIIEEPLKIKIQTLEDIKQCAVPTSRKPTEQEYKDLIDAWWVAANIRSNGVAFQRYGIALAIGTGNQDRIGAIESCIAAARRTGGLERSVMASDGFIPNIDNVQVIAREGVTAIVQPGGSVSDCKVIEECNLHGIAMVFTGERAFSHF